MKVFGEPEGIRLVFQGDDAGKTTYVDLIMDEQNTENLIHMLAEGIAVHKGIKLLTFRTVAEA
jgi:hypothetical protein